MQLQSTADLPALLANSFFWAAIGLAAGFSFLFRGFTLLRRRKLILNTPRSTVRGAAMGPVEISGKVVGPYTLISPLSAVDCYYYRARAWQSNQHSWKRVAEETLYAPFSWMMALVICWLIHAARKPICPQSSPMSIQLRSLTVS